ncbi:MAG: hypothetical protein ACQEUM_18345, partial [Pseudomonadota bacterium]
MSSILAYSRFKKCSLQGLALGVLGLSLSGCGLFEEDLSDRPYVMSCTGGNIVGVGDDLVKGEHLPDYLAGLRMPDHSSLLVNREGLGQEIGFTADRIPLAGNVAKLPVSLYADDKLYRDTGDILVSPAAWGEPELRRPTFGQVEVEHLFLTRDGDLKAVEGFHIARFPLGHSEMDIYRSLNRTVAAVLPSDAAYAVFRVSGHTQAHEPSFEDPIPAMTGASAY